MVDEEGRCNSNNIVMGELAAVRQRIENFIQRVRVNIGVEHLQETTLLKTLEY